MSKALQRSKRLLEIFSVAVPFLTRLGSIPKWAKDSAQSGATLELSVYCLAPLSIIQGFEDQLNL